MNRKSGTDFNHTTDTAPEYVDVILWRRVVLAAVALAVALAAIGLLLYSLLTPSTGESEPDRISQPLGQSIASTDASADISPDQLPAPAAVPLQSELEAKPEPELTPEAELQPKPESQPVAALKPEPESKPELAPVPETSQAAAVPAPAPTQTAVAEAVKPDSSQPQAADRYQVQTEILSNAVKRAALTTRMRGREPGTALTSTADLSQTGPVSLYQFVDLRGRAGDVLTYTWKREGKIVARVRIPVGSDQWRNNSSKNLNPRLHGNWQVDVSDRQNRLLVRTRFYLGA